MVKPPRLLQVDFRGNLYPACLHSLFATVVAIALVLPGCQKKQQGGRMLRLAPIRKRQFKPRRQVKPMQSLPEI